METVKQKNIYGEPQKHTTNVWHTVPWSPPSILNLNTGNITEKWTFIYTIYARIWRQI